MHARVCISPGARSLFPQEPPSSGRPPSCGAFALRVFFLFSVVLSAYLFFWLAGCLCASRACLDACVRCVLVCVSVFVSLCARAPGCACVRERDTHAHTQEIHACVHTHTGAEGAIDVTSSARGDADERDDGDRWYQQQRKSLGRLFVFFCSRSCQRRWLSSTSTIFY